MHNTIQIFKQLIETTGSNDKIEIVKENANNSIFLENLAFLVDKSIVTGLSSKKLKKDLTGITEYKSLENWSECLSYIKDHNTGSDIDILTMRQFIDSNNECDKWFYEGMLTKSLRIGMTVKSVNKAIPNLIATYNTQQGYLLDEKHMPKEGETFVLTQKLNGINGGIKDGKCLSRQGKPIYGMNHIVNELSQLGLDDMYVNGELMRINNDNLSDEENFRTACSIINSKDDADKLDIELVFYEVLTKDEFESGKSEKAYLERLKYYQELENKIKELQLKHVRLVPVYYVGSDKSKIDEWLNYANEHGLEGIMLNKDTHWINRRNYGLLKVKTFLTADLRCTGVLEGKGKNKGTLGSIVVDYKGYELGVGGFTDAQRAHWWAHPEEIIGKIVTVKYKTESNNKDGGLGVQFPTFVGIRFDKDEVSYN